MDFKLKKYWYVFVLLFILLFSYYVRALNIVPDRLLSYDPIFQYRFTKYFADWGHLPVWDELTYYVGRMVDFTLNQPLMYYITGVVYWIFGPLLKLSLMTVASYMSAIFGAIMVIPAFLLARELSNKYGGLLAAVLIGTAPQILTRTFGSSYDTDQIVEFFLILTLWAGFYALKKKNVSSFCLALACFSAFMLSWSNFWYTYLILAASIIFYFILNILLKIRENGKIYEKIKFSFNEIKSRLLILLLLAIGISIVGFLNNTNVIVSLLGLVGFAQASEQWIVNVSIAELQPFSIFNLGGWITAMGNFISGDTIIDMLIFSLFIVFLAFGIFTNIKKKDVMISSFLITLFLIAIYTTFRGVRFTEYTASFFIIMVSVGFGGLVELGKRDVLYKSIFLGLGILIILFSMSIGFQVGKSLGPDVNSNWDNAWTFLNTKTPELSIIGTWWDPGHMITGLADRRAFADGAHCEIGSDGNACLYTINDRIADLGKIMATDDENVSLNLIRKYQGDSPNVYWIASDDLIGKYQWLQYFGTGCDARTDQNCPLYMQIPVYQQGSMVDSNGNVVLRSYPLGNTTQILIYNGQIPIPIYIQGINAVLFNEIIVYNDTQPIAIKFNESELNNLTASLKPLEKQLNIRFSNQTIPMTIWIPNFPDYIVVIPPSLRNTVFTRMFMLEGQGLDHFKEVFRNDQVKIFEVV